MVLAGPETDETATPNGVNFGRCDTDILSSKYSLFNRERAFNTSGLVHIGGGVLVILFGVLCLFLGLGQRRIK